MKHNLFIALVFLCGIVVTPALSITSMWPYVYGDFQRGTVSFKDSTSLSAEVNVHLLKSTLHYLKDNQIIEANTSDIVVVRINLDTYYVKNNQLLRFITGDSVEYVAELVLADFDGMMSSGGAYGSSSNVQATSKLTSVEVGGVNITNHMELKSNKEGGALLPLIRKYVLVTPDKMYPATRKGIESLLPEARKASFKQFLKTKKVSWKDPASLVPLLDFL